MNKSDNKITFSAFYNNITIHFYEDDQLMENAGKTSDLTLNGITSWPSLFCILPTWLFPMMKNIA